MRISNNLRRRILISVYEYCCTRASFGTIVTTPEWLVRRTRSGGVDGHLRTGPACGGRVLGCLSKNYEPIKTLRAQPAGEITARVNFPDV